MSGGVDSSVAAHLLTEQVRAIILGSVQSRRCCAQDYDLSAVYMRNWDTRDESGSDQGCEWKRDWEDVQRVCRRLGLPCEMVSAYGSYSTAFVIN